jgi:hypothetical protein
MQGLNSFSFSTLMFAFLVLGFGLIRLAWPARIAHLVKALSSKQLWLPLSTLTLAGFLVLLGFATTYGGFIDHVESNIASVSYIASHGQPMYHGLESAQRYALLYGPMTYLPYMGALALFGANVPSIKLVVAVLSLGTLVLLLRIYGKRMDWQRGTMATAMVVLFLLGNEPYAIVARADVILIFAVSVGLAGVLSSSRFAAGTLLAVATGLCVGAKVSAGLYVVPLFVWLFKKFGARTTILALCGAGLIALLPFGLPQISLSNYLLWIGAGLQHPIGTDETTRTLKMLITLVVPILALLWRFHERNSRQFLVYLHEESAFLFALVACLGLITAVASKAGAGDHHYLPFYPLLGYVCCDIFSRTAMTSAARDIRWTSIGGAVFAVSLLWLGTRVENRLAIDWKHTGPKIVSGRMNAQSATAELQEILQRYPNRRIEMGYGETIDSPKDVTKLRPVLIFAGNPLTIDQAAIDDMNLSRLEIPSATLDYQESCQTNIWLIPRGENPFTVPSFYSDWDSGKIKHTFNDNFRETFLDHYKMQSSTEHFDLWTCD